MEGSNPAVTGDWGPALRDIGVPLRDEAYMGGRRISSRAQPRPMR